MYNTGTNICKIEFKNGSVFDLWDFECAQLLRHNSDMSIKIKREGGN